MRLAILGTLVVTATTTSSVAQVTSRVSVDSGGAQANGGSFRQVLSSDGRFVAFESAATNLVSGDTNGHKDIFVHDQIAGTTERMNVDSGGVQANASGDAASISADGRYVAFWTNANNLVTGDTNFHDVFVRDRVAGTTELASVDSNEVQANVGCYDPAVSGDGRYVAFWGEASNLVPGDANDVADVFVRDRVAGTTERVSVDSAGAEGNSDSSNRCAISGDGRYVAFQSAATNLVSGDTNGAYDVFVRDRQSGTTERVSVDSSGTQGNGYSYAPSISADGRYVAFWGSASNLVVGDTNLLDDVFVRDRLTGTTERVSLDSGDAQVPGRSEDASISADGRYVAFWSYEKLVSADTNGLIDVFVRDRVAGTTELASIHSSGSQGNGSCSYPALSGDGRWVGFTSAASNLVADDTNGVEDVFVHDREASGFVGLCDPGEAGVIACPCSNPPAGAGRGCDNFGAGPIHSGTLTAAGAASLASDSVVLQAAGENNTSLTVFWTGSGSLSPTGVAHGAGVRCVTTDLKRLYSASASAGAISRPGSGDPSVSARTAAVGAPISAGETRHYFAIYRDPNAVGPCGSSSSTVNLTNAGSITWDP